MGKHKEKRSKSKKSKKQKKEKRCKHSRRSSAASASEEDHSDSSSNAGEEEIVWTESGKTETADLPQPKAVDLNKDPKNADHNSANEEEGEGDDGDNDGNDWLGFIEQKSKGNVKLAHLKRDIRKKEQDKADNKVRYARELNSYYRDDVNKRFIDDPDEFWKNKSKSQALETEESSEDNSEEGSDKEYADEPEQDKSTNTTTKKLTDAERNAITAKIFKAEMLGDTELVAELQAKLKDAENATAASANEQVQYYAKSKRPNKAEQQQAEEKMSVKELYFQTKSISTREEAMRFVASSSKLRSNEDEYEEVKGKKKKMKIHHDGFVRIRAEDQAEHCGDCLEKLGKHLALRFSAALELKHCFVAFTPNEPFVANYCQIRSRSHSTNNSVSADEECWRELRQVMRLLEGFFSQNYKCSVLFMETHFVQQKRSQNCSRRHFVIDCVPIKERYASDARIYFHKAILETGEEWSINRKMIKLEGKPVTKMIPKGLGYFWVSFDANFNGFAHVIEDEDYFSKDFGKEIIGGLRDIEPAKWKRPRFQDYDAQMKRIAEAQDKWQSFMRQHS